MIIVRVQQGVVYHASAVARVAKRCGEINLLQSRIALLKRREYACVRLRPSQVLCTINRARRAESAHAEGSRNHAVCRRKSELWHVSHKNRTGVLRIKRCQRSRESFAKDRFLCVWSYRRGYNRTGDVRQCVTMTALDGTETIAVDVRGSA